MFMWAFFLFRKLFSNLYIKFFRDYCVFFNYIKLIKEI